MHPFQLQQSWWPMLYLLLCVSDIFYVFIWSPSLDIVPQRFPQDGAGFVGLHIHFASCLCLHSALVLDNKMQVVIPEA